MSSGKTNLSRERIGEIAVAIADRHGFRAVTMRRIARQLDVGTMSLYYYVKTKDDLIAVMDDALMGEMLLPALPSGGWRAALLAIAERTHAVLLRHSWAISAMLTAPPGPNAMRHMEQCLEALAPARMTTAQKLSLLGMVDDFVFGHALREAAGHAPPDLEWAAKQMATGRFPRLQEAFQEIRLEPGGRRLKLGLAALLAAEKAG
jgi:AcrR family transcriptional regulator